MRSIIIVLIVIFSFNLNLISAENLKRQDPFLAGALSWYMAGLGQIYAGKYLKGAIFWIVDYSLYITTILTVADINFSSNKDIGFQINIKPKEFLTKKDKTIAITCAITYVSFHIYNVIDAVRTVYKNNLKLNELENKQSLYFDFEIKDKDNYLSVSYKF